MTRKSPLIVTLLAALWTAGCLEKETTHTLYLSPSGEVTWMAIERNVRSDEAQPAARAAEESRYLAAAVAGEGDIAMGLGALGPVELQSRVLRDARPFAAMTEARFANVEALADRILSELHLAGNAKLTSDGDLFTWRVHVDVGETADDSSETPVTGLVEELAAYQIVLTEGKFTRAEGFTLSGSGDGAIATPMAVDDEKLKARGGFDLLLSWRARWSVPPESSADRRSGSIHRE